MMVLGKSVRNSLVMLARVTLPTLGFGFTCLGAFLLTINGGGSGHQATVASAYACIILGFLLLIAGVFWAICLSMRSKAFLQSQRRRLPHRDSYIFSIDRPDFYPPSYEESSPGDAVAESAWVTEPETRYNIAPPLYTASITEVPSEDYSSEDPPPYSETVLQGRSQQHTPLASPTTVVTLPGAPLDGH